MDDILATEFRLVDPVTIAENLPWFQLKFFDIFYHEERQVLFLGDIPSENYIHIMMLYH